MRVQRYDPRSCLRPDDPDVKDVCLIIGGGAWASCFFLGLVDTVQSHFPSKELSNWAFCGESAGCIVALALALGLPAVELEAVMQDIAAAARARPLGAVGCAITICEPLVRRLICERQPEAVAIQRLRGRFAVTFNSPSATGGLVAYRADQFESADEVWEAIVGSASIPGVVSLASLLQLPRVGGRRALDGGITPTARVPMLPCRCAVYAIACGNVAPSEIEPIGLTVDVEPSTPVPCA